MGSRKEEERNEKIIRGLMKLPPNRRCINCNSLGPQYVCTNFWTFICMTCSGIHREFTHRVKSVSMAKFTSQEVEALQKGGNQRAREVYLKDWDLHGHRLPSNSNVDKIRDFIKNVYVDKKYAGGKSSDRPPRDVQNPRGHEDETRRASSYHSYSQSPPYDFQYEERRYGKHAPGLTRKPGSDRGLYEGKLSSFLSPSRSSDHMYEDGFVNEGSVSRASDYSSSGGDPLRSGPQSPNFQKDVGSPLSQMSREDVSHLTRNTFSDAAMRDAGRALRPQRAASLGSLESFDSNSFSFKSVNSVGSSDVKSEQSVENKDEKTSTFPSLPRTSVSENSGGLDQFKALFAPDFHSSAASTIPSASYLTQSVDLSQASPLSTISNFSSHQTSQVFQPSSLDLFAEMPRQPTTLMFNKESSEEATSKNEGWATFDIPKHEAPMETGNLTTGTISSSDSKSLDFFREITQQQPAAAHEKQLEVDVPKNEGWATFETSQLVVTMSSEHFTSATIPLSNDQTLGGADFLSSLEQWPSSQDSTAAQPPLSVPIVLQEGAKNVEVNESQESNQPWNAFGECTGFTAVHSIQNSSKEPMLYQHPSIDHQYLDLIGSKDSGKGGIQDSMVDNGSPISSTSSYANISMQDLYTFPTGLPSHAIERKSSNPFDLPCDYDIESSNEFWDMSSLQDTLPNGQTPTSLVDSATQPWFPHDPVPSYVPTGAQATFSFVAAQSTSTPISNVPNQGPVASVGGNPFA